MKSCIMGMCLLSALMICMGASAPQPSISPRQGVWTLDVAFNQPQQISVQSPGSKTPARFWYIIITVTNQSGKDAEFFPKCDLMTDTFQILPAGKNTPPEVFQQIKGLYGKTYPLLECLDLAGEKILQGKDNARDICIIWPDFGLNARNIKLFLGGLSNETAVVNSPAQKDANGAPVKVYLRKTIELSYDIPGDPAFRSNAKLVFKGNRWIMR